MRRNLIIILIPIIALLVALGAYFVPQEMKKAQIRSAASHAVTEYNSYDFNQTSVSAYRAKIKSISTDAFFRGDFSSDASIKALGYDFDHQIKSADKVTKVTLKSSTSASAILEVASTLSLTSDTGQKTDALKQRVQLTKVNSDWKLAAITNLY
jgi:hypothetical protein